MLQLVYISSAVGAFPLAPLLSISRRNNARDQVTGLLYADSRRFLQALEGPDGAVEATFRRIAADQRHRAVVVLSRRTVDVREFGAWEMAERSPGEGGDAFVARIGMLLRETAPDIRATFDGLVRLRNAA